MTEAAGDGFTRYMIEHGAISPKTLASVLGEVGDEVARAEAAWSPFNSAHEGFATLHEEFDELKAHVWTNQKRRELEEMRKEAIQVAAMAVRFVRDICDGGRGRK